MRLKLKLLRTEKNMNQEEFSKAIGFSRTYYNAVENGKHPGSLKFWKAVQNFCDVPDSEFKTMMEKE